MTEKEIDVKVSFFFYIFVFKNFKGNDSKVLNFNEVYMRTHRRSSLFKSKFALKKFFRYLINCAGGTRQNRFLRNHDF